MLRLTGDDAELILRIAGPDCAHQLLDAWCPPALAPPDLPFTGLGFTILNVVAVSDAVWP